MVEDEKAACNHEDHLGQLQFIALCRRNLRFEEMDRFIAEETNGATAESRQFWARDKLIARHQLADFIQWVACHFGPTLDSQFGDLQVASVAPYDDPRI